MTLVLFKLACDRMFSMALIRSGLLTAKCADAARTTRRRSKEHRAVQAAIVERLEGRTLLSGSGWTETIPGPSWSNARFALNVDADENIYVATAFTGTVDFEFGPGVTELTEAINASGDIGVAKYTKDRQLIWATTLGGGDRDLVKDIEVDSAGNVYVTGRFYSGTIHFGHLSLSNNGSGTADAYVAKLDANGNFLWAYNFGGTANDYGSDIALTAGGDVLIAGQFQIEADFDPDPIGEAVLTGQGGRDAVLWKLSTDGDFHWVKHYAGPGLNDQVYNVVTDDNGDIFVQGSFSETVNFGSATNPITLTSSTSGFDDKYILKLDSNGETIWARQISGPEDVRSRGLALTGNGSLYVAGSFDVSADFGLGNPALTSTDGKDLFVSKWDTDGMLVWVKQIAGVGGDLVVDQIAVDAADSVVLTGQFQGTADFDPDPANELNITASGLDAFLAQLDGSGSLVSAYHGTGSPAVRGEGVAVADDGDVYAIGTFQGTATLYVGDVVSVTGSRDTFLTKVSRAPGITLTPASGLVTSESGSSTTFEVVLDLAPTADVTIALNSSDLSEGTVSPSSLTFTPTNWHVPQTVTVAGVDDVGPDGDVAYAIVTAPAVSSDPSYDDLDAGDVLITNLDVEAPLFEDSFEVSEWNGNWIEDVQNDWFRNSQRAIDGVFSAEIDGTATDATLTMAQGMDLTPYGSAEVTYSWYIESNWDSGEYIALDFFDGDQWGEVRRLQGDVDQEDVWHRETIIVGGSFLVSDFKIRFRSTVSSLQEDGQVDDVKLMATSFAMLPVSLVSAVVNGSPTNSNRSGIGTLDLTFDLPVSVSGVTSLALFNHSTGQPVDISTATLTGNGTPVVSWQLSALTLPDGRYTAEIRESQVTTAVGGPLASTYAIEFHVLAGDLDGDAVVNFNDTVPLSLNFGASSTPYRDGDTDGDGVVNFNDTVPLSLNFGTSLAPLTLDFGDAPQTGTSFPTTLANNGARHFITGNALFLGDDRDAESDGQPNATATGDGADENGLAFALLLRGTDVNVTVTSSGAGYISGWIDFNQDGDWGDLGEQVFVDQPVVAGPNALQIAVPAGATLGSTFARFRLTGSTGYSYFGLAPNGEVEDYQLTIADSAPDLPAAVAGESFISTLDAAPLTDQVESPPNPPTDHLITVLSPRLTSFEHPLSLFSTGRKSRPLRR